MYQGGEIALQANCGEFDSHRFHQIFKMASYHNWLMDYPVKVGYTGSNPAEVAKILLGLYKVNYTNPRRIGDKGSNPFSSTKF